MVCVKTSKCWPYKITKSLCCETSLDTLSVTFRKQQLRIFPHEIWIIDRLFELLLSIYARSLRLIVSSWRWWASALMKHFVYFIQLAALILNCWTYFWRHNLSECGHWPFLITIRGWVALRSVVHSFWRAELYGGGRSRTDEFVKKLRFIYIGGALAGRDGAGSQFSLYQSNRCYEVQHSFDTLGDCKEPLRGP